MGDDATDHVVKRSAVAEIAGADFPEAFPSLVAQAP